MNKMKCLNLYVGVGGNRKLWPEYCKVTAVEINPEIANVYQTFFPFDTVIVDDAHEYLLNHFQEFDFIWSSPPCQSHSTIRQYSAVQNPLNYKTTAIYPDLTLYQEIIFLQHNMRKNWVVENVKPYYELLIPYQIKIHRHLFWSNFWIAPFNNISKSKKNTIRSGDIKGYSDFLDISLDNFNITNKRQILRNCVHPKIGEHIFSNQFQSRQLSFA